MAKILISKELITTLIKQEVGDGPLFLVDLTIGTGNKIHVELDGDQGVGIDDCVKVSRAIETNLDRETEDFELEVSSAGIGKPLKIKRQYTKNVGRDVMIRLSDGNELKGRLTAVNDQIGVELPADKKKKLPARTEWVAWDSIKECKVIISFK